MVPSLGEAEADRRLREIHRKAFFDWLCLNLEQQHADLLLFFSTLEADKAAVVEAWSQDGTYQELIPEDASVAERSLYLSDFSVVLEVLRHQWPSEKRQAGQEETQRATPAVLATIHDLNNLLMIIACQSQLLLGRVDSANPVREVAWEINRVAEQAMAMTHQLLPVGWKEIARPRTLDLNAIVRDMEGILRALLGDKSNLVTILEPALGHVRMEPGRMERILLNLAANARDAMPQGGTLTIETANVAPEESGIADSPGVSAGPRVVLAVGDTGVGMDAETRSRLFEPFFTTKEEGKGTGLGLTTVRRFVERADGSICVHSSLGWGTTFEVFLPRVTDMSSARAAARQESHSH